MDELINQITQRTGISADQARQAAQTVVGFLKDKLPGPIGSQLDGILNGQGGGDAGGASGNIGGAIGGMFGGDKSS